jgi:hypothetical protein
MKSSFWLTVFILLVSALLAAGCTTLLSSGAPPPPASLRGTDYQVRVNISDTWYGTIFIDGETTWKIEGSGPETFDIPGSDIGARPRHSIIVEATIQSGVYQSPLTIEVLTSGEVAASMSMVASEKAPGYITPNETLKLVYYI